MNNRRSLKRVLDLADDDEEDKFYRLKDGTGEASIMYEDNSLQAVWSCSSGNRKLTRDEIGCSAPHSRMCLTPQSKMGSTTNPWGTPTQQTPSSQFRVVSIRELSSAISSQTCPVDMAQYSGYTEILKAKLNSYTERRLEVDERLKCLETEQEQAVQELNTLQASLEPLGVAFPENAPPKSLLLSKKGVFGIVALLGSVTSTSLSRVLSEYLGEDTMLGLVCKSSRHGPNSDLRLESEAARLGRSITNRFHVLCLGATRPWMDGLVENDPQRKLVMDDPKLPDEDAIPGFKGYAVNIIDLVEEELHIKTYEGHGLRETLFYSLFGNLQVYETQTHVEEALPHINGGGAVALDGFIAKGNEFIYSGCRYFRFT